MRLPRKSYVDKLIVRAQKTWGMKDWTITWSWGEAEYGGLVTFQFPEKTAQITLDRKWVRDLDRKQLFRLVLHETGVHTLLHPIERGLSDWLDH